MANISEMRTLLREGMRLFPVVAGDKKPLLPDWPNRASDCEEQIEAWGVQFPRCNWAVATGAGSGSFVVDFDGPEGMTTYQGWAAEYGEQLTETRSVRTARGLHAWFQWPEGETRIRNSAKKIAPGVDVRGEGGYVIVPPSLHPSGARYQWVDASMPIQPAPKWLINLVVAAQPVRPPANGNGHGTKIPQGERNAALTSLAGSMRRRGMDADAILAALSAHNAKHCEPPLSQNEIQGIADSVGRYQPAAVGPVIELNPSVATRVDMPEECLSGRLGEICQRRLRSFPRAYAWPALLAAASVQMPRVVNNSIRTNVYCCLCGPTASGKSTAIDQALYALGISRDQRVFQAKYGSAEGMLPALMERIQPGANCLLCPDELAHLLGKASIERSSFPTVLNSLYYHDEQSGGTKGHKVEFNGRLSLVGGVVEEMFGQLFGSSTTGGLYDRFLFGLCPEPFAYCYTPLDGPPETIPEPIPVEIHREVWEERAQWLKNHPQLGRNAEHALRVAVICAAYDGRAVLRARDLISAFAFAFYQNQVRTVLTPNPGENPDAQCAFLIRAWLEHHATGGFFVKKRDVYRGIHADRMGPGIFDRAVRNMAFCDELVIQRQGQMQILRLNLPGVTTGVTKTGDTSQDGDA